MEKPVVTGVQHVGIGVRDIEASRIFYRERPLHNPSEITKYDKFFPGVGHFCIGLKLFKLHLIY